MRAMIAVVVLGVAGCALIHTPQELRDSEDKIVSRSPGQPDAVAKCIDRRGPDVLGGMRSQLRQGDKRGTFEVLVYNGDHLMTLTLVEPAAQGSQITVSMNPLALQFSKEKMLLPIHGC